jgi:hypothetical protein
MRSQILILLPLCGGLCAAQETTSLFLPYFSPGHLLLASVVDAVSLRVSVFCLRRLPLLFLLWQL